MYIHISEREIRLLCDLKDYGDQPTLPSNQRIRLEMLGLAADGPCGLCLTEKGKSLAVRIIPPVRVLSDMSELAKWNDTEEPSNIQEEPSEDLELIRADAANLEDGSDTPPAHW